MSILFAGGEDSDFPLGAFNVSTTAAHFRAGYARCALGGASLAQTAYCQSFSSPLANLWAAARVYPIAFSGSSQLNIFGVTSSANPGKGIWVQAGPAGKVQVVKNDGSVTVLQAEAGTSLGAAVMHRIDVRIQNYGATGTVTLYVDLNPVVTFTGNIAAAGVTGLDQVGVSNSTAGGQALAYSEVIAADEDTRALSVVTLLPNALGTTDQWTGTYTDINESTMSDATVNTTNVLAQLQQYALSDIPAGNFAVKAVAINARATAPAGSTAASVGLGVQTGGGTDTGTQLSPGTGLVTLSRIMATDPTSGSQWTTAVVNAMQMVLKSGA